MTPPGLCLLFNNAYSSLSPHADSPAQQTHTHTHTHTHTRNRDKHSHNSTTHTHTHTHTHTPLNQCERLFFSTSYLPPTVYKRCLCRSDLTRGESPSASAHEKCSSSSRWSEVYEDLHTIAQNELITGSCAARVNIFYVIWKHGAQPYASQERWKEARNEEREQNEEKIRDLWPSTAVRMKAILSSVFLLASFSLSLTVFARVCIALFLSRLPLFLHRHFSS